MVQKSNSNLNPVFAGILNGFSGPPTTTYREPHPSHNGHAAALKAIDAAPGDTFVQVQTAEDAIDPSRSAPLPTVFVGNELDNKPLSSVGEDADDVGRTDAPISSAPRGWKYRCTVLQRASGFDAMSPGGKFWLKMTGAEWCRTLDEMSNVGAFRTPLAALDALDRAPQPPDADSPTTAEYVPVTRETPKHKVAMCPSARDRVIAHEPSHYLGATGTERTMREAEFARGQCCEATSLHLLALNATNLEVLREQIRREMLHRQHLFSEINTGIKNDAAAVVAA